MNDFQFMTVGIPFRATQQADMNVLGVAFDLVGRNVIENIGMVASDNPAGILGEMDD